MSGPANRLDMIFASLVKLDCLLSIFDTRNELEIKNSIMKLFLIIISVVGRDR